MYWYNDRPRNYRRNRRGRGAYGFPWIIFAFFWLAPHFWWAFFVVGIVLFVLIVALRSNSANVWMGNQQQYYNPSNGQNPYQQKTSYQPSQGSQPYEQQAQQPYYHPYEQGYQPQVQTETYYNPEHSYNNTPTQSQEDPYQAYDQPRAEYPQQMPPM